MSTHQIPSAGVTGIITVPDLARWPARYYETFDSGIGHWTAGNPPIGGPRDVVNGVFRSWNWSYDSNHLTSVGGPGMLQLLAYADDDYFNRIAADGTLISSDFTRARIKMTARGTNNFQPNGSEWIIWTTSNHPTVLGKNVNWGFIGNPITSHLLSGNWEEIEVLIDPDPSRWVWGKGPDGTWYDTFLSLPESLRNIYNLHMPLLGPDNVGHATGQFELDTFEIIFNKNGPDTDPVPPPQDGWTVAFNPVLNTLSTPNTNYAIRGVSSPLTAGGNKIRATVFAPPSNPTGGTHLSIGKQTTTYHTAARLLPFLFSGSPSYSVPAGGQLTSDPLDFVTNIGDVMVTHIDCGPSFPHQARTAGAFAGGAYYALSGADWEATSPSGFTDSSGQYFGVRLEVHD